MTGGPRPPGGLHWPARIAFVAAAVALVAVVLLLDVLTPLGAAVDGLYAIAVLVSALARLPRLSLAIVLAASVLVLSGLAFSRDAQVPWQIVVINRAVALALVWVTYLLIQRIERARAALEQRDRQLAEHNARLARLATEDPLTGVANRRRFDALLPVEVARAQREQQPLALLMIDIDRFKEYNDRRGHPAGDECLIRVAQALAAQLHRPSDLVARIGGEEFAVLLPNTELGGAGDHAERIRAAVESLALTHPGGGVVTVSIGVAVTRGVAGPQGPDELLASADRALYRAKDAGRNLVAV